MNHDPIGEVTLASTTRFQAVTHQVFEPPRFGSFVKAAAAGSVVYGVVGNVSTASMDSGRRPVAFGMSWERLVREQPQLVELLQTGFDAIVVAHEDDGGIHHHLPPYPPRVHEGVYVCDPTEVSAITASLEFVRTLAGYDHVPAHEMIAAAIREAYLARGRDEAFRAEAARAVGDLYKDDYATANAIVSRLR